MATISMDLRQRILKAYDRGDATREEVANRFEVSPAMDKRLLQQRRHSGDIAPRHHRSGRKPIILDSHRRDMRLLLKQHSDLTLEEIRARLSLECTIQAIHYVLADMGLTYKKDSPCGRTIPTRRRPRPPHLAQDPSGLRTFTSRLPRRIGGQNEYDSFARSLTARETPLFRRTVRSMADHHHDWFGPAGWQHRLHDG